MSRQGCLLSLILFNLFLEKIVKETLHDHHTTISTGGRPICNLQFAADIDLMSGSNGELQNVTNRLVDRAMAYGIEDTTENRKIMTNTTINISADISMNGQKLEEVWLMHVTCHDSLSKTILQGTFEGGRCRGQHRKS